jgi:type II secretory pathway predicted ATPase ExeA/outer membrane protein OmpA-like peptidoglycan-associated protein
MFESYYKLNANPFRLSADEQFRFAHKNYLKAWTYLRYALEQEEGFVMLTGRPGSGKTTLIRDIISELDRSKTLAINLVTNQLQAEELLRKVALEFGLPAETYNKATLLTHIEDFVTKEYQSGRRAIIVIDEAQNLTLNGLEELRLLSNLQTGSHPLFQIFLVGQDELRTLVLSPGMEQIRQRLVATCQIESMNMQQTEGYIEHRLGIVGWDHDPEFNEVIYPLIYYLTEGIPRKINHVASRLLLYGALEGKHSFTEEDVWIVARELFDEERLSIRNGDSFTVFKERYEQAAGQAGDEKENVPAADIDEFPQEIEVADIDSGEIEPADEVVTDIESVSESGSIIEPEPEPEPAREEDFDTKIQDRETGSEFFPYGEELAEAESESPKTAQQRVSSESDAETKSDLPGEEITKAVGFVKLAGSEAIDSDESGTDISTPEIIDESSATAAGTKAQPGEKKPEDILNLPSMQAERRKHEIDEKGGLINTVETIEVEELFSGIFAKSLRNIFFFVLAGLFFLALFVIKPEQIDRTREGMASKLDSLINPQPEESKVVSSVTEDKQTGTVALDVTDQQTEKTTIKETPTNEAIIETTQEDSETNLDSEPTLIGTTTEEIIIKDDTGSDQQPESQETAGSDPVVKASKDYIATQSRYEKIEIGDAESELETSTPLDRKFQIYFEFDNPDIPEQFKEMLNDLYIVLSLNKASTMKITGYTDASGDPVYNMNLSMDRAKAVSRYFTERGIEAERIQVEGRGPVPKSTDEEHETLEKRFGNRRVEIMLRETGG